MPISGSDADLVVDGLAAGYGSLTVVRDVSFRVRAGEFVCLLGPNGVGKSTLLRALVGDATVTAGTVRFGAHELTGRKPHRVTRHAIALVPEGRALVPDISVRDNLLLGTARWNRRYSSGAVTRAIAEACDRFPVLGQRRHQLAGSLSGGEQQMLAIARALVARPRLLLLDEPSLGLAPALVRRVFDDLLAANQDGLTILVAEQNATAAQRVARRSLVMSGGRIATPESGTVDAAALQAAFLGRAAGDAHRPPTPDLDNTIHRGTHT